VKDGDAGGGPLAGENAMRALISLYLLWKSATRQKLDWFDIRLVRVMTATPTALWLVDEDAPDWQHMIAWQYMIATMKQEAPLPEAFVDWRWELEGRIRDFFRRLWGRS
jgi:hypothetical protein